MENKAIIFDLFGTLVGATSPELQIIKEWNLSSNIHDDLQRVICGTKFNGNYNKYYNLIIEEISIIDSTENRKKLKNIFNLELEKALIFPKTKEILGKLKKEEYRLGLISNAYPPTRQKILEENDLVKYFDTIFLSYEIGVTKQNPKCYRKILNELEVNAEDAIMIGGSLKSDIEISKQATGGKIGGILISQKQEKLNLDKLIIVPNIIYIPKTIEKYFSNPIER